MQNLDHVHYNIQYPGCNIQKAHHFLIWVLFKIDFLGVFYIFIWKNGLHKGTEPVFIFDSRAEAVFSPATSE